MDDTRDGGGHAPREAGDGAVPAAVVPRSARRLRRMRAAAVLVSVCAALFLAEVAVRVRYAYRSATRVLTSAKLHVPDPVVGYRLLPGGELDGIHVNSLGLRGAEVSEEKPAHTIRVLCIGDSITWGQAASADAATYPAQLERELTRRDRGVAHFEVLNGGVGGYGSLQCVHRLREYLTRTHPDEVLVCAGWNDVTFAGWRGWHRDLNWVTTPDVWTLRESFLLDLARERFTSIAPPLNPESVELYREDAEEMIRDAHSAGAGVAFLDLPTVFGPVLTADVIRKAAINGFVPGDRERFLAYRDVWRRVAADEGVPFLATGLDYEVPDKEPLLVDVCHPNDAGYERMAQALAPNVALIAHAAH